MEVVKQAFKWLAQPPPETCPVQHYHLADPTCGRGTPPPGAQGGPHYHVGSTTCHGGSNADPAACNVPHWHWNDPSFRPAQQATGGCSGCGGDCPGCGG